MDWDDLRVFLAVGRAQSLSGAGRVLKLDAATVGRRIVKLEEACGARLFSRSPQGYGLTDEGARLLPHAESVEAQMQRARDALTGPTAGISGQIRLGAPDGCANYLLPPVIAQIMAQNPALDVQIVALPRVINLSRREADMVIAVSKPQQGRVIATRIADYRLHLAGADRYLAQAPALHHPRDLPAHRVIGYIPDLIFDRELDYLADLGITAPPLASNSVSVQLNLIRQGAGVGVVHDFALPAVPGVRRVLTEHFSLTRAFWLLRHADDRHVPRVDRFAQALITGMRAQIAQLEAAVAAGPSGSLT